ncbi:MAG: thiol-disulfide isomerase/thioredoxin [Planctomycetota bacterium]|jgi:thiol-disulfide isomerase/thioredoxin
MQSQKTILLLITLVLIIGGIWYLQSKKVTPSFTEGELTEESFVQVPETVPVPSGDTSGGEVDQGIETSSEVEKAIADTRTDAKADVQREVVPESIYPRAPEISTIDGYINVDDITIAGEIAKGNIVLLDVWTYSCINCQRTIPFLNNWQEKYGDKGLTIIGLHTPEFEFEKKYENVVLAVDRFDIEYPVVLDNDYSTWQAYKNQYWPRKYLINLDGRIVYDHIGEGGYEETEQTIIEWLNKTRTVRDGAELSFEGMEIEEQPRTQGQLLSRESYLGYERIEYVHPAPDQSCVESVCSFEKQEATPPGRFSFEGDWQLERERSVLKSSEGSIWVNFIGSSVNLVAGSVDGLAKGAEIYLDGALIDQGAGAAVQDGKVLFLEEKLYQLVNLEEHGSHLLEIRLENAKDFAGFAFTFG